MGKKNLSVIILLLVGLLAVLQTCQNTGAFAAETDIDEIKVIGIGLGIGNEKEAGNYNFISGFDLSQLGENHASEILNRLAGFNIQHGSGQEHLTAIRSPVLTGGSGAGSFLFLEDGVSLRAAGFGNVNGLFESINELAGGIEAIKGPGSALYGSNSVHGVVNVLSKKPQSNFENDASLRFGFNPFSVKFIASSTNAIGKQSAGRLGFSYLKDSGWRNSTGVEQFKAQLRIDNDNFLGAEKSKTLLSVHRLDQETGGYLNDGEAEAGDGCENNLDYTYRFRKLTFCNSDPDAYRKANAVRGQNNILWRLNKNNQFNLTSWFRWTAMEFLMHFLPQTPVEKNAHGSFGVRPIWQSQLKFLGEIDFNFGGEFEYTNGTLSEIQTQEDGVGFASEFFKGTHYDYKINAYTLAFFTQNNWALEDNNTNIYFGLRGEWVRYDYKNKTDSETHNNSLNSDDIFRPNNRTNDFFTITPKIGINYRLPKIASHQIYIFTDYTRGARAPQTTDLYRLRYRDRDAKFKPERLDSFELGFRGTQRLMRWELTGFYMNKSNYHFRDSRFEPILNGKTRHAGLELEFFAPLFWNLDWKTSFSYARHWYAFNDSDRGIKNNSDIDTAPRTLLNMELAYNDSKGLGRLAVEYILVGSYYTDAANENSYSGHSVFNLRSEVKVAKNINLFFNVFNLADKRYADRADFVFGSRRYFPAQPRAYYLGLKTSF